MEKTIIACAFLMMVTLQWHAHYSRDAIDWWTDIFPILVTTAYLVNRFIDN